MIYSPQASHHSSPPPTTRQSSTKHSRRNSDAAAMERAFEVQLDQSLQSLRQHILEAYREGTYATREAVRIETEPDAATSSASANGTAARSNSSQMTRAELNRARSKELKRFDSNLPLVLEDDDGDMPVTTEQWQAVTQPVVPSRSLKSLGSRRTGSFDSHYAKGPLDSRAMRSRLQLRLGAAVRSELLNGKQLLEALQALGLTKYTLEEMCDFVQQLANYINLAFVEDSSRSVTSSHTRSATSSHTHRGEASWTWPKEDACVVNLRSSLESPSYSQKVSPPTRGFNSSLSYAGDVVPTKALQDLFLTEEAAVLRRKIFDARAFKQFQAMREILLAGDTNRLVAELTFVRINDLAAPPETESHPLAFLEHVAG
eukprot:s834_g9.t1